MVRLRRLERDALRLGARGQPAQREAIVLARARGQAALDL
jgi:hypothetical protein